MDLPELNEALLKVREAVAERERLTRALDYAEKSLEKERLVLDDLSGQFRKEDDQVRRLEGVSLVGLIYTVLGSKETRLEGERQELLAAKLKYDNAQTRVKGLERDVNDLRQRLAALKRAPDQYSALLSEKERLLTSLPGEAARRLSALSETLAQAQDEARELDEAIQAGEQARAGLDHAVDALESASSWGTLDILGGGMLASAVKHSRLDEAQEAVQNVQPLLQRFERELSDVGGSTQVTIETGGLTAFADIFVDSLLVDLLVQSRIGDSLDAARGMDQRIRDLLDRLVNQRAGVQAKIKRVEADRRSMLESL